MRSLSVPKCIPNSWERNLSNVFFAMLSQMLSYFFNEGETISEISLQELLLFFNWGNVMRNFNPQSTSIKWTKVSLVKLIRAKEKLPASHTNSLHDWVSSEQRMNSFVINFDTDWTSFLHRQAKWMGTKSLLLFQTNILKWLNEIARIAAIKVSLKITSSIKLTVKEIRIHFPSHIFWYLQQVFLE